MLVGLGSYPILQVVPLFCSPCLKLLGAGKGTRHWCRCSLELSQVQLRVDVRNYQSHIEMFEKKQIELHQETSENTAVPEMAVRLSLDLGNGHCAILVPSLYHPCISPSTYFTYSNLFQQVVVPFAETESCQASYQLW